MVSVAHSDVHYHNSAYYVEIGAYTSPGLKPARFAEVPAQSATRGCAADDETRSDEPRVAKTVDLMISASLVWLLGRKWSVGLETRWWQTISRYCG
jgi:hypothetical protein